jgi:hypothetical protein
MSFPTDVKEEALFRSRRCCCIFHVFAGLYTNVHNIIQESDGGPQTIENAVVLCLTCHGQVGHYNPEHPIGNKYSPSEVRRHRDAWWKWCENNPYAPLPHDPVTVSPATIYVAGGGGSSTTALKTYNKTDNVLYQVWIKLHVGMAGLRGEDVKCREFIPPPALALRLQREEIYFSTWFAWGITALGNEAFYICIASMDPKQLLTIPVEIALSIILPSSLSFPLTLLSTNTEPPKCPQEIERPGEAAFPFIAPETMQVRRGLRAYRMPT